jgi:ATP-dependent DNA helicase PIF1
VFFLSGAGGTGKTYVYKTVCHCLQSAGKIVPCVASSGIAALLLPGGCTAHSTFRIPIDTLNAESLCNISKQDKHADLLCAVDLIVWDEAPMQSHFTHEALDHTLWDICDNESTPFSGKVVIFGGNFQQTLPVLPKSLQEDIINVSLPCSYL